MKLADLYLDVEIDGGWVAVGIAWCEVIDEALAATSIDITVRPHCCVRVISPN